ncbi:MAG: response regulator transcription factor [Ignavibacteria bacterium]|nr:response regulator transcription factor [Ignavibacteria bacterium]
MIRILVVEDDPAISTGLKASLETEGYKILVVNDGEEGLNAAMNENPTLILLDIMLPSMSGLEICMKLRNKGVVTPIIMLTARAEEADKLLGFELGADDYVTKPFSMKELLARIKAILKRRVAIEDSFDFYEFDDVKVNFKNMETTKGDKHIKMSLKEYELLKFFIRHIDEVVTRNTLLDEVWGYDVFPTTRTVDNYIMMLRKKIETNPAIPKHIQTIHSAGYKFVK